MLFVLYCSPLVIFRIFSYLDFVNIYSLLNVLLRLEYFCHPFFTVGVEPFWDQVVGHFLEVSFSTFCFFDMAFASFIFIPPDILM
jgi:hypothetical protein